MIRFEDIIEANEVAVTRNREEAASGIAPEASVQREAVALGVDPVDLARMSLLHASSSREVVDDRDLAVASSFSAGFLAALRCVRGDA